MLEPWTTENKEILPFKERYSLMLSDRKKCPISTLDTSANCILKYINLRGYNQNLKELIHKTGVPKSTFSKMKKDKDYKFDIRTLVALAIGLNIDTERFELIVKKAGLSLNESKEHVFYKLLIENHGTMTMEQVNRELERHGFSILAGKKKDSPNKKRQKVSH